jgi:POT family proton-dependent oligopeptide transporter
MPRRYDHGHSHRLLPLIIPHQFVGFYLAYTLPTVVFLLCPIVLWYGRDRYIRSPPTGSVLATTLRLWKLAARGRWSWNPYRIYKNMTAADFWENAKPSNIKGPKPSWMTFDDNWVDEVRRGFKACSVFCWFPIYCMTFLRVVVPSPWSINFASQGFPTTS